MGGPIDVYVDPANPNSMAFNENATRLNRANQMSMQRGAIANVNKGEKKEKKGVQTAQGIKSLLADLESLEKGTKTLLGM